MTLRSLVWPNAEPSRIRYGCFRIASGEASEYVKVWSRRRIYSWFQPSAIDLIRGKATAVNPIFSGFSLREIQDNAMSLIPQVDKNGVPVDKTVGYRGVSFVNPRRLRGFCVQAFRRQL